MSIRILVCVIVATCSSGVPVAHGQQVSKATKGCLVCHRSVTPGIVADWETSRHSMVTPADGMAKESLYRRISTTEVPQQLRNIVVGCAECHTLREDAHKDTFVHSGNNIHTIVSMDDCAVCHPAEKGQYQQNLMSNAHLNLAGNPLYRTLINAVNGTQRFYQGKTTFHDPDEATNMESCFYCHGTRVRVDSLHTRQTIFGVMEFPTLVGWPNQGCGRINPDGSVGSCTPCHARHGFSIEVARKPYTCSECHKGPDVPAYKVYSVSKMGNIYSSLNHEWDFTAVPWKVGDDFTAPTCATCHVALLVGENDEVLAPRSHMMGDRIYFRLFGLPYAHPHLRDPNTTYIKNAAGLNLPTELNGDFVTDALIDKREQERRKGLMMDVCKSCHSTPWTENHFASIDNVVRITNEFTRTATQIMQAGWDKGVAQGLAQNGSIFDEAMERKWMEEWFFYANSVRLSAAMAGADYGVFDNGRWYMTKNIQELKDWLEFKLSVEPMGVKTTESNTSTGGK